MSVRFNRHGRLVVVRVRVWGPNGTGDIRMALDTGATSTLINDEPLIMLGYDPTTESEHSEIATANGLQTAPIIVVERIRALDQERSALPVICHTLPPSVRVDGLLGLDFLRGQRLTINFRRGEISLA
jgi:aspartyl protease family protein